MKPEQKINERISKALRSIPCLDAHRVEMKTGELGWPDWIVFFDGGKCCFLEAKWGHQWTVQQRNFALRKTRRGFSCFLVRGGTEYTDLSRIVEGQDGEAFLVHISRYSRSIPNKTFIKDLKRNIK
jgi:hypothetical protein